MEDRSWSFSLRCFDEFRARTEADAAWETLDSTRARVAAMLQEEGLASLDLTPLLRANRNEPLFLVADAHLTSLGNERVAQAIAQPVGLVGFDRRVMGREVDRKRPPRLEAEEVGPGLLGADLEAAALDGIPEGAILGGADKGDLSVMSTRTDSRHTGGSGRRHSGLQR